MDVFFPVDIFDSFGPQRYSSGMTLTTFISASVHSKQLAGLARCVESIERLLEVNRSGRHSPQYLHFKTFSHFPGDCLPTPPSSPREDDIPPQNSLKWNWKTRESDSTINGLIKRFRTVPPACPIFPFTNSNGKCVHALQSRLSNLGYMRQVR